MKCRFRIVAIRVAALIVIGFALAGCAGPNYAPYDHMTNSYG